MSGIDLHIHGTENLDISFSVRRSTAQVNNPLQTWAASLDATDRFGRPVSVASARILHIPNARFQTNVLEVLSDVSDNARAVAAALVTGHAIPKRLFTDGSGLLVIDSIRVDTEYRSHKLGHIIVRAAQDFLLEDGHGLTALVPASMEDHTPLLPELTVRQEAQAAKDISVFWRDMGFKKHGVCLVLTT